ncbi:MAG: serine/threonine protein kinase [Proteobacteria bacterium]|nr:serine/threonine protein kinase [Pseudomonadota bacterium]MCP4916220.1 serine/threonine protein kinase [Pseudomonadota bacterium]
MQTSPRPLGSGRYELMDVLGEGGMATVFRARDTQLDVERALKLLDPTMTRGPLRKRFILEAQTMARLHHPNLVAVHDVHSEDPVFMVMDLMVGSVHRWLSRHGPMPAALAVAVVRQVLLGLAHAHEQGVVHRDVKPQNILVSKRGVVRLTDFGIAQVRSVQMTRTGAVMGTYAYMAPEQRASAKHVDARADIYSVGATLYALLTDLEPNDLFATETHKGRFGSIAQQVRDVVVRACAYAPEDRYQDVREMLAALEALELPAVADTVAPLTDCVRRKGRETHVESMISDAESGSSESDRPAPRSGPTTAPNDTLSTHPEDDSVAVGVVTADDDPSILERPPERTVPVAWLGVAVLLAGVGGAAWWTTQEPVVVEVPPPVALDDTPLAEPLPEVEGPAVVEVEPELEADVTPEPRVVPVEVAVEVPVDEPLEPSLPGVLVVNTIPWGYVSIDGGPRHRIKHRAELDAGAHTLVLESNDERTNTVQVDVPSDGELVFCWDFNKGGDC